MANYWKGDPEALAALAHIESTGYKSKYKTDKKDEPKANDNDDYIVSYNDNRGYGFTKKDVFFHAKSIISGEPRIGAKIRYDIKETSKGVRATNVRII